MIEAQCSSIGGRQYISLQFQVPLRIVYKRFDVQYILLVYLFYWNSMADSTLNE